MRDSRELNAFKETARRFHSAYHLANLGLSQLSETILSSTGTDSSATFTLTCRESGEVISTIPTALLQKGIEKDGPFSQVIALSVLSWIYTSWNEKFRRQISREWNVPENDVMSDVMGDLRMIRNAVAHDFETATSELTNLKVLTWFRPGRLILTSSDMDRIQLKINSMRVYVRGSE
jgi:hypothetical protein